VRSKVLAAAFAGPLLAAPSAAAPRSPDGPQAPLDLPLVQVTADDQVVRSSCLLEFPSEPLADVAGDGVVWIEAPPGGLSIHCRGELRGAPAALDPDQYRGVGLRLRGADIELHGARVRGFRVAIEAAGTDGLSLIGADVSDNFRQRLHSDFQREDPADWLSPHRNDGGEWRQHYGAGLSVERSRGVHIEGLRARQVQNGILLDRVTDSVVTRCDASFLSGFGLALWRSSHNRISANRFEFCVRGYSHGRYNRGQDSAGVLLFEQCGGNVLERNSLTHGGDGIFAFAGREALGEEGYEPANYAAGRGNNGNRFEDNDLSFAAAHGLECTFSFDNLVRGNLFEGNAICGLWFGYARRSRVEGNRFVSNGEAGYGAERGAINAEHARELEIVGNVFRGNRLGVRLWTDEDPGLRATPWGQLNGLGAADNRLLGNDWREQVAKIELRAVERTTLDLPSDDPGLDFDGQSRSSARFVAPPAETASAATTEVAAPTATELRQRLARAFHGLSGDEPLPAEPARERIPAGRAAIVIDEWGPYDWSRPYLQPMQRAGAEHRYRLLGPDTLTNVVAVRGAADLALDFERALPGFPLDEEGLARGQIRVRSLRPGRAVPYRLLVRARGADLAVEGLLLEVPWALGWFATPEDPREHRARYAAAAAAATRHPVPGELDLDYGHGGPASWARARGLVPELCAALASLGSDHFGTVAEAQVELPAGRWRLRTRSDDGIRVELDGAAVIEDWTWHAPSEHRYDFERDAAGPLRLAVQHFELDGYATLQLWLEPRP
jgi:nitrous oxidase accessory protein NosD